MYRRFVLSSALEYPSEYHTVRYEYHRHCSIPTVCGAFVVCVCVLGAPAGMTLGSEETKTNRPSLQDLAETYRLKGEADLSRA